MFQQEEREIMNLNKFQRIALCCWLIAEYPYLSKDSSFIHDFNEFCDGKIREWRIISKFGMAGKIWNNNDRIYISGYSPNELKEVVYLEHCKEIDAINKELEQLLKKWSI
jgi:hypothetical protein